MEKNVNEENLENVSGGRRPSGTWVPVDEECSSINQGDACPFDRFYRHFENCHDCRHKNSD
ncbi:MAG: hypothetical protein Q4F12_04195 [Erysipelotrichaceae bacterium]|nr:hypothetical protein [Erysipelotrichaceae bacterium]